MRSMPVSLACLLLLLIGCASAPPRAEIDPTLDAWHRAASTGDFDAYFSRMTPDAVFLGTDATERWTRAEFEAFARPYFDGVEAWTYTPVSRHIGADPARPGVAWFDELLTNAKYGTCRGSGVVVIHDGRWKIAHYSLTFPIPNALATGITAEIRAHEAQQTNTE